ncbi:MAG: hypothetical protein ABI881_08155 [Betaproteobacteria bacterium]
MKRACALLVASWVGACATTVPFPPDTPHVVAAQPIAPWQIREDCADAGAGDRIDFRFESTDKVGFDLYYRQGSAVIIPLSRQDVIADAGVFAVEIPGRYCLAWKAGAAGAAISYHVTVHSSPR